MYLDNKDKLILCKWDIFNPYKELIAVFSTRKGGYSLKPYDTLNLGFTTEDDSNKVKRNRILFFETLSLSESDSVTMTQVHGCDVLSVDKLGDAGIGDGLMTNEKNIFLCGTFADCSAVVVFDPIQKVVGLFHAGWMGLVCEIIKKGIEKISKTYDVDVGNLLVGISPHIKSCCFEIKEDVASQFDSKFLKRSKECGLYLNMEDVIVQQLCDMGVKVDNIEKSAFCTSCEEGLFYSYRRDKRE